MDTADGEHQLSAFVKKGYRQGDHRGTADYSTRYHNRLLATDLLVSDLGKGGVKHKRLEGGLSSLQEAVRTGKNVMSAGKNVLKFPLVLLTLTGAPLREALEDLDVGGRLQSFMDETEGLSEFRARLGVFLYRSAHDGRDPPRGDAGNVDRLPMPSDGFIIVCTMLAVAPGRVPAYRRGHVAAMPVRTGVFYRRRWECDVEIMGEEMVGGEMVEKRWYARVLMLFR
jgi:hypothetical protein